MKKMIITGANGFIGEAVINHFANHYTIVGLVRKPKIATHRNVTFQLWNGKTIGDWAKELEYADILLNLAGKSVDCRYTEKNKALILSSRINSTQVIGKAIESCQNQPKVWMNMASSTIYAHTLDRPNTEQNGTIGTGFSVEICKAWEHTFQSFTSVQSRQILLRTSIVLGTTGGAFVPIQRLVKFGLGGKMGMGNQYISWIHVNDFCKAIQHLIEKQTSTGVYNIVSPNAVRNRTFQKKLQKTMHIPIALPQPKWLLELGARIIGTETELILKSRFVYPERLLTEGFLFEFERLEECLQDLCGRN